MIKKIFCFFGVHTWINTNGEGIAGKHICKFCGKLGWELGIYSMAKILIPNKSM